MRDLYIFIVRLNHMVAGDNTLHEGRFHGKGINPHYIFIFPHFGLFRDLFNPCERGFLKDFKPYTIEVSSFVTFNCFRQILKSQK